MRIAAWNTWGTRGSWEERLPVFRAELARIDADILSLQETVLRPGLDQAALMLGEQYHLAQQSDRESGREGAPTRQGITTASRWPIGEVIEIDLNVTERTGDFACTCMVTEILAPSPLGRIWVANHFPDYQLDHERERRLQTVKVARRLEQLVRDKPGHVIVAGDLDADPAADSLRFWTGRHVIEDMSVCYRSATEALRPGERLDTYLPSNPHQVDPDWPFRAIDHVLVRCGPAGPTLLAQSCERAFDTETTTASDHYGLMVDYETAGDTEPVHAVATLRP